MVEAERLKRTDLHAPPHAAHVCERSWSQHDGNNSPHWEPRIMVPIVANCESKSEAV